MRDQSSFPLQQAAAHAPMLDAATERDYLIRIQDQDDRAALRALLESHLRLVLSIARKYARRGVELDDLIGEGNLGLLEAARRFDRSKSTRYATYAAWWVRAYVRRYALDNRRIVGAPSTRAARRLFGILGAAERELAEELGERPTRERLAAELGVSVDDVVMVEAALGGRDVSLAARADGVAIDLRSERPSPEDEVADAQQRAYDVRRLESAIDQLAPRERRIVRQRLVSDTPPTLRALGASMGLSRERVRQLQAEACERLREELSGAA